MSFSTSQISSYSTYWTYMDICAWERSCTLLARKQSATSLVGWIHSAGNCWQHLLWILLIFLISSVLHITLNAKTGAYLHQFSVSLDASFINGYSFLYAFDQNPAKLVSLQKLRRWVAEFMSVPFLASIHELVTVYNWQSVDKLNCVVPEQHVFTLCTQLTGTLTGFGSDGHSGENFLLPLTISSRARFSFLYKVRSHSKIVMQTLRGRAQCAVGVRTECYKTFHNQVLKRVYNLEVCSAIDEELKQRVKVSTKNTDNGEIFLLLKHYQPPNYPANQHSSNSEGKDRISISQYNFQWCINRNRTIK